MAVVPGRLDTADIKIVIDMMVTACRRRGTMRQAIYSSCALAAVVIAVAGCGGSSKPGYCADRANLNNSINELTSLSFSSDVSTLKSQLQKIQSNATALVNSAKSDFPNETSAITSSIDQFKSAVEKLPSNPTPQQIATLASSGSGVLSSVKSFSDATNSKCK